MGKIIDYFVELIKFPNHKVKEAVTENEDGTYTIFIEESLSRCEQQNALLHALRHIMGLMTSGKMIFRKLNNTHTGWIVLMNYVLLWSL